MKTLPILNSMLVLASGAGLSAQQANAQQKPHIILIMSDQHRADALGCMGNESVISPNIDQLSREGTLFCNGYSSTPSSTPARAGLLTGMSPWHHGMLGYGRVAEEYNARHVDGTRLLYIRHWKDALVPAEGFAWFSGDIDRRERACRVKRLYQ